MPKLSEDVAWLRDAAEPLNEPTKTQLALTRVLDAVEKMQTELDARRNPGSIEQLRADCAKHGHFWSEKCEKCGQWK